MNHEPPRFIYVPQETSDPKADDVCFIGMLGCVAFVVLLKIYITVAGWYRATVVWLTETRDSISMAVDEWYNWLTEAGVDISVTVEGWYHAFVAWLAETGAYIASFWPF